MCTLIVAHRVFGSEFPIVVAANRDELLDRPSEPPALRCEGTILAPKDLQRGGSWIGVNHRGVLVALTNRMDVHSQPGKESRGDLVMRALSCGTAHEAFEYVSRLDGSTHNGFNLVLADARDAFLVRGDGTRFVGTQESGLLVVTNRGVATAGDDEVVPRCATVLARWRALDLTHKSPYPFRLQPLLDIHADGRHGTCIHEPEANYGTKSSSIICLRVADSGSYWRYWHRERSSMHEYTCAAPFAEVVSLPVLDVRV